MNYKNVSVRLEENLKKEFEKICDEMGMKMSAAFAIFVKAVVRQRRIPFDVEASTKKEGEETNDF